MARKNVWPPEIKVVDGVEIIRVQVRGRRHKYTLGPAGSAEARAEYLRVVAEMEATRATALDPAAQVTVAEVALRFIERCDAEVSAGQADRVRSALDPVVRLYGHTAAAKFGPVALATVRDQYVRAGRCRRACNQLTSIVRQAYKWAASREIVSADVYVRLATLGPLLAGKTQAKDRPRVKPAPAADVEKTLPHLPPAVADMVRVQLLTGCRPGELCLMHPDSIERPGLKVGRVRVWLYDLDAHKTAWRGGRRTVAIGPKAQAILKPYLELGGYLFSPRRVVEAYRLSIGAKKKRHGRSRVPGERYRTSSYGHCIAAACERAGVPSWSPNRLRHAAGTRVEADHGREDARCVLGHSTPTTTAIYAEMIERAARVAAKDG